MLKNINNDPIKMLVWDINKEDAVERYVIIVFKDHSCIALQKDSKMQYCCTFIFWRYCSPLEKV